jgi:sugar phosphate permease
MNMLGNIGGAVAATVVTYTAARYGWNVPFLMTAGLCLIAAVLYLKIDASQRVNI